MSAPAPARVLVVGAGLAGLTAAHRLQCAGLEVTVADTGPRPGGRLHREKLDGFELEPSNPVLPGQAVRLFGLIHELGLSSTIQRQPLEQATAITGRGRAAVALLGGDGGLSGGLRRRRLQRLLARFGQLLDPSAPEAAARLDDRSIDDFSDLYLGRARADLRYAPLLESQFGIDSANASRLLLMLLLDAAGDLPLWNTSGLADLPAALASGLLDLRLDTAVEWVRADGREARFASGDGLEADATIIATPATQVTGIAEELLPAERIFLSRTRYTNRLHVAVTLPRGPHAPTGTSWIVQSQAGPLAGVVDLTPLARGGDTSDEQLVLLMARPPELAAHPDRTDREWISLLTARAGMLYPPLRSQPRSRRAYRLPGSVPRFDVGTYRLIEAMRRDQQAASQRRLYLCGDYLVGPHLEAAVASAERVAVQVAHDCLST